MRVDHLIEHFTIKDNLRMKNYDPAQFYALHSRINAFFAKRTVVKRNTPSMAFKNALQDDSLLVLLGAAVNSASTEEL